MKNCKKVGIHVHGDFIIGLPGETKETIEKTIDFAKELDCETIQVSMAHAYPGTELYDQGMREGFLAGEAITDDGGHQLPHLEYPGLSQEYMVDAVNRFYDSYYFRPRVAWRIVRDALWDGHERKRLFHEAVDFLKLRADRKKVAREGRGQKGDGCRAADRTASEYRNDGRVAERMTSPAGLRFKTYLLISLMIVFGPVGDVLLSKGMKRVGAVTSLGACRTLSLFLSRIHVAGLSGSASVRCCLFFIAYILVLSWADYSYVQPASSIAYGIVALLGYFVLGEAITPVRWVGVLVICAGSVHCRAYTAAHHGVRFVLSEIVFYLFIVLCRDRQESSASRGP